MDCELCKPIIDVPSDEEIAVLINKAAEFLRHPASTLIFRTAQILPWDAEPDPVVKTTSLLPMKEEENETKLQVSGRKATKINETVQLANATITAETEDGGKIKQEEENEVKPSPPKRSEISSYTPLPNGYSDYRQLLPVFNRVLPGTWIREAQRRHLDNSPPIVVCWLEQRSDLLKAWKTHETVMAEIWGPPASGSGRAACRALCLDIDRKIRASCDPNTRFIIQDIYWKRYTLDEQLYRLCSRCHKSAIELRKAVKPCYECFSEYDEVYYCSEECKVADAGRHAQFCSSRSDAPHVGILPVTMF